MKECKACCVSSAAASDDRKFDEAEVWVCPMRLERMPELKQFIDVSHKYPSVSVMVGSSSRNRDVLRFQDFHGASRTSPCGVRILLFLRFQWSHQRRLHHFYVYRSCHWRSMRQKLDCRSLGFVLHHPFHTFQIALPVKCSDDICVCTSP